MTINSEQIDEQIVVFSLDGNFLGEHESADLTKEILQQFEGETRNVIVNLEKLRFINSSGLNVFLTSHKKASEQGKGFALTNVSEQVDKLLNITKLDSIIRVYDSLDSALKDCNP